MRTASPRCWSSRRAARLYEFQRLHGMGRLLYAEAARQIADFPPVRVYAPVGEHKDLLAYLVRRLLENGANTSFVNRFMDEQVPVARDRARSHHRARAAGYLSRIRGCRLRSRSMRTGATPSGSTSAIPRRSRPLRAGLAGAPRRSQHTRGPHHQRRSLPGRVRDACGHQSGRSARYASAARAMRRPPRSRGLRCGSARAARLGRTAAARVRADCLDRAAALLEKSRARFLRAAGARGGQDLSGRDRRGARSGGFLPLLRGARARGIRARRAARGTRPASSTSCRCTAAACSPASARGIFRWRFSRAR